MAKRGRKSAYEIYIKPRFSEISEWLKNGATEKQIYENLGVSRNCFYKYKKEKEEFGELLKNGRKSLVLQLRGALVKKALGFSYVEKKIIKSRDMMGEPFTERIEETVKQSLPDVAALNLCLKNYDSDEWANDPQNLAIKKEELELKKKAFEEGNW